MSQEKKIGRRSACKAMVGIGSGLLIADQLSAADQAPARVKVPPLRNADFYEGGKFLPDRARQAYYAMFARFGYPNPKPQQDLMWVQDFGLGDFVNVGMAGVFWYNDQKNNFFGHEIYLLPGQQIPEHKHVKTANAASKMEAWHVRHGKVWCFGEGAETKPCPVALPKSQESIRTVNHAHEVNPGEVYALNRLEAFHFMIAGPEGAIVSEYATYHDGAALRFANPKVKF